MLLAVLDLQKTHAAAIASLLVTPAPSKKTHAMPMFHCQYAL
jgi:hypothetical protein